MIKVLDLKALEEEIVMIDDRMFLLRNRGDRSPIFARYAATGAPTAEQIAFIVRHGVGQFCEQLDGAALPTEGIHDWGNGWGCVVLDIALFADDAAIAKMAIVLAKELSEKCCRDLGVVRK